MSKYQVVSIHDAGTTYGKTYESFRDACRDADAIQEWYPDRHVKIVEVGK